MSEANRDEIDKCKQIALSALAAGDTEKAVRFLQKAKRMCPSDSSIDALLAKATSQPTDAGNQESSDSAGPRHRASAAGSASRGSAGAGPARQNTNTRVNKEGQSYTAEQAQEVHKILRERDYYAILSVSREANEDTIKRAYKKLALKLHPDKNKAPGAEDAFKKVSKAVQCLSDEEKKHIYDRYGDEERIPTHQRQQYQQDFMTPEDLFAAFFGGGTFNTTPHPQQRRGGHDEGGGNTDHARPFQLLPLILLVLLTFASNFVSRDSTSRFAFSPNHQYRNELSTATLNVKYYVTDDFDDHYAEGTQSLAEFEQQVEIYYVRNLHSECDYQEKVMYKQVMIAKRHNDEKALQKARNHPRPACKELDNVKRKHSKIYRSAMYMSY